MTLSPGDTIQIILTVGGVPYAKTENLGVRALVTKDEKTTTVCLAAAMMRRLINDIDLYANETESADEEISKAG